MTKIERRSFLSGAAALVGVCGSSILTSTAFSEEASLSCSDHINASRAWNDVPEYKWGSPERTSLREGGLDAEPLTVTGRVLTRDCKPVAAARLEFWQADPNGKYDWEGYKLRGHQLTDAEGRFRLETIMPGFYFNLKHIHFLIGKRIQAPTQGILTAAVINFPTKEEVAKGIDPVELPYSVMPENLVAREGVLQATHNLIVDFA